ncbi:hypothetical protein [Flavonifractor hominis]|uniref:Zinc ribbon domain-containing protein n=1 Tax=Flavonifractor hominis TaxID=3133178 RepID=A0ABV1EQ67_9FIRM
MERAYKGRRAMEGLSTVGVVLVCAALVTQFILLFVAGLVLIAVSVAILHLYWRCPDCGAFLGVSKTETCPSCGRPIA